MKMETRLIAHMFTYWCESIRHLSFVSQKVGCGWTIEEYRFDSQRGKGFFSYPKCPDQLQCQPCFLSSGQQGLCLWQ